MTPFDLVEPTTLKEALGQLDPDDPAVRPLGGGTALMLMMKAGIFRPTRLVSLRKVAGMSGIKAGAAGNNHAQTVVVRTGIKAGMLPNHAEITLVRADQADGLRDRSGDQSQSRQRMCPMEGFNFFRQQMPKHRVV